MKWTRRIRIRHEDAGTLAGAGSVKVSRKCCHAVSPEQKWHSDAFRMPYQITNGSLDARCRLKIDNPSMQPNVMLRSRHSFFRQVRNRINTYEEKKKKGIKTQLQRQSVRGNFVNSRMTVSSRTYCTVWYDGPLSCREG